MFEILRDLALRGKMTLASGYFYEYVWEMGPIAVIYNGDWDRLVEDLEVQLFGIPIYHQGNY